MAKFKITNAEGGIVGFIEADALRLIAKGIDFQPNIFNGYHAVEFGSGNPPAVLNIPVGMDVTLYEGD